MLFRSREVVRREIAASSYPRGNSRGPDYSDLLPEDLCNCPDCRRARGEMSGPFDDPDNDDGDFDSGEGDFEEDAIDDETMKAIFDERVPPGMPPEVAGVMYEIMKEAYLNGIPPDEILASLRNLGGAGGGSRSKRKKGKRK